MSPSQRINHRILQCPGFVLYQEVEAVSVFDRVTQVVRKYPEMASDSVGRSLQTELYMLLTLPVYVQISIGLHVLKLYAVYGSYNACNVSTCRGTQIVNPAFFPAFCCNGR